MSASPSIRTVDGRVSFAGSRRVLAVDPDVALLQSLLDAWTAAVPQVSVRRETPRAAEPPADGTGAIPCSMADGEGRPRTEGVPTLAVLARKGVLDGVFGDFHGRSQGSGLREADRLSLSVLEDPQPNSLVVVDDHPIAVVDAGDAWIPIGDSPTPSRAAGEEDAGYAHHLASAAAYPLRTPSRESLYRAFANRCDPAVARDLLALLDATPTVRRHDPCDHLVRAYVVGARHGVLNYDLRRASEDCNLASPSTLSTVKAELEADDLLDTDPVQQPRGRPRQRLSVGVEDLETAPLAAVPELVRELRKERDGEGVQ